MKIKIANEVADSITVRTLEKVIKGLEVDLEQYSDPSDGFEPNPNVFLPSVFSLDKSKDIKEIKKHIKAARLLMDYLSPVDTW